MEVYNPLTNKTCQLPDLPDVRMYHSLCGGLLCGGGDDKDVYSKRSCLLLDPRTGRFDCTLVNSRLPNIGTNSVALLKILALFK